MFIIFSIFMSTLNPVLNASQVKAEIRNWYAFEGPLGEVVHNAKYFFAWREGRLIGTFTTLDDAMKSLERRKSLKTK